MNYQGVKLQEYLCISRFCNAEFFIYPRYPAESFYEALQSQWFIQMFSRLEQKTGATISNGRMDQYLYPYYKKDIEAGILTREKAKELFTCMWLAMAQYQDLYISPAGVKFNEGYAHWEAVTVGGVDENGNDAVNDLTYILLENKREFPLNYPDLAARIHSGASDEYLKEIALTIKEGSGFPKLINDDEVIPLLKSKGADNASANDYAVSGCTEVRMPNLDTFTTPCAFLNLGAVTELTLRNGRMKKYGNELLSIGTAADSLAAVKKHIYEEKDLSWDDVTNAIDNNFSGYEAVRSRLMNSPKYGNDDPYVDELAKPIDRVGVEFAHNNAEKLGINIDLRYVSQSSNVPFGKVVSALPNGRYEGTALSDGASASQGADVNGPTSVLLSNYNTKNTDYNNRASRLLKGISKNHSASDALSDFSSFCTKISQAYWRISRNFGAK